MKIAVDDLKYDERGLVPAVVQDAQTGEVLTLAYMNAESLRRTLDEGETWFWSRSRSALWHKGETSSNTQRVVGMRVDCDGDALVALVEPSGAACHTGARSCFHHEVEGANFQQAASHQDAGMVAATKDVESDADSGMASRGLGEVLAGLYSLVEARQKERPEGSYTTYLFDAGLDKILKKVGEEAAETIIAAKNEDANALTLEVSDLVYHLVVLLVERGVSLDSVSAELLRRSEKRNEKGKA
ncbi:MAG TPA: bifunctional phosphoribosyl-AMP cyclohydrolase/phosphoribosyl-ATP diphosphatase HisIE [Pyrinomonadaceae bacterium]|jgi:phosphoribosyl-ATP pyrophosphohydrolase/phosphoribosyl-AMP cyclohydrolase